MGQVVFKLDAEEGKAVSAFLKLVEAQKKTEKAFKDVGAAANKAERDTKDVAEKGGSALDSMKSAALRAVGGFLAFSTVKTILTNVVTEIHEARDAVLGLEKDLTRVISLQGDLNRPKVQQEIRDQVLDRSGAYGLEPKAVADLTADVQARAGHLDRGTREQYIDASLRWGKYTGEDPRGFFDAETTVRETYPESAGSITQVSNRLAKLREHTGLDAGKMNELLAKLLPAGKATGYGLDEMIGSLAAADHSGGDRSKFAEAIGIAVVKINEAQRSGLMGKTGSLAGDLQAVDKLRFSDPEMFKRLGLGENVPAIAALGSHADWIAQGRKDVSGVSGDYVRQQLNAKLRDETSFYAEEKETSKQMLANGPKKSGYAERFGDADRKKDYRELGLRHVMPTGSKWIAGSLAWAAGIGSGGERVDRNASNGYQLKIDEYRAGGRPELANALDLERGLDVRYPIPDAVRSRMTPVFNHLQMPVPKFGDFHTAKAEREEYQAFVSEGGPVELGEGYFPYLRQKLRGDLRGADRSWRESTHGAPSPLDLPAAPATQEYLMTRGDGSASTRPAADDAGAGAMERVAGRWEKIADLLERVLTGPLATGPAAGVAAAAGPGRRDARLDLNWGARLEGRQ